VPAKPTLVQLGTVADLGAADRGAPVTIAERPDAAWEALFLGPGFDPVDGASRAAILRRSRASVFAAVRQGQEVVAVGSACFSQGLCGVHGMRTAPAWRGRGLAGSILGAFAREARARGITQVLLQVEEANTGAQSLYRRAGLRTAWRYRYWQPG
jgi:ribosomal protein S18 acetylase RimI-like enzyme